MREQFAELGGGITDDGVAAADAYGDALGRWHVASQALQSGIATRLLPLLTRFSDWLTRGIATFSRMTRGTHTFEVALGVLGAVALTQVVPALLAIGAANVLAFAGLVAAVLVIDDLIALFRGGNSAIGQFIDRMMGVGTAKRWVTELQVVWDRVVDGFNLTIGDIRGWWAGLTHDFREAKDDLDDLTGGGFSEWLANFTPASLIEAWDGFTLSIHNALEALGLLQGMTNHGHDPGTMSEADTRAAEERVRANARAAFEHATAERVAVFGSAATESGFGAPSVNHVTPPAPITVHVHGVSNPVLAGRVAAREVQRVQTARDAANPRPPR